MALNLRVNRDGTKVVLTMNVRIPNYEIRNFPFEAECGSEEYAGLLTQRVAGDIGNAIEEARNEAYNRGYSDAKAKRRRALCQNRHL